MVFGAVHGRSCFLPRGQGNISPLGNHHPLRLAPAPVRILQRFPVSPIRSILPPIGVFLSDDLLQHRTGIRFCPSVSRQVVLRLALLNVLVPLLHRIQFESVDAPGRNSFRPAEGHENRIDVGAFSDSLISVI